MSSLSNDVKTIVYRYLYDEVVDQISAEIPIFIQNFNIEGICVIKVKGRNLEYRRTHMILPSIKNLFSQDIANSDPKLNKYTKVSIINGSIYELYSTEFNKWKLNKITSSNSCWQQLLK